MSAQMKGQKGGGQSHPEGQGEGSQMPGHRGALGSPQGFPCASASLPEPPACTRRMNPTFLRSRPSWHSSCSPSCCSSWRRCPMPAHSVPQPGAGWRPQALESCGTCGTASTSGAKVR